MGRLIDAIRALATDMNRSVDGLTGSEKQILTLLEKILNAAQNATDSKAYVRDMNHLHRIWVHSIDWCSTLSRQLEKIIMLHQEQMEGAAEDSSSDQTLP